MDDITASLLKEAGVKPAGAPSAGWQIPANVQAERDAAAGRIRQREQTGAGIPTSSIVGGSVANADPITAALLEEANVRPAGEMPKNLVDQIPNVLPVMQPRKEPPKPPTPPDSPIDKYVKGPLEAAATIGSGVVAGPAGVVGGIVKSLKDIGSPDGVSKGRQYAQEIADSLTYKPTTQSGKDILGTIGKAFEESKLAGLGPTSEVMAAGAMAAQPMGMRWIGKGAPPAAAPGMASAGSAAADTVTQARGLVSKASPELREIVESTLAKDGKKTGINIPALKRQVEADSLPVPVRLTKGQATQDLGLLSTEQNDRGKIEALRTRFNEQNRSLIDNTTAIREAAAPDVFATSKPEIGAIPMSAIEAKDAALRADISAKYAALRDANGGNFPLDVNQFAQSAEAALKKELKTRFVSPELRATINDIVKEGKMSFEDFEALRTITARIQRSPTIDGNAKAAAGIIRNELEKIPMPTQTLGSSLEGSVALSKGQDLKALADAARSAAKSRFDLIESDPAYKAVINGKVSADNFIDKFIIRGSTAEAQRVFTQLDDVSQQAIRAGIINQLRENAGVIADGGNFSQAGYNKALSKLEPKLRFIFEPEQKQQLETLGNVAKYTQAQPRGSFVNNSNTATALMAEGAKNAAEGAVNVAAKGLPIGTYGRKIVEGIQKKKKLNETLQTGAGIRLDKVANQK